MTSSSIAHKQLDNNLKSILHLVLVACRLEKQIYKGGSHADPNLLKCGGVQVLELAPEGL